MNLRPPNMSPHPGGSSLEVLEGQWQALHAAAEAGVALTGAGPETPTAQLRQFPAAVSALAGGRRRLVEEGLADPGAIMDPGLAAQLSVHERGGAAVAPAQALWQEFVSARALLMAVAIDQPADHAE